MNVEYVEVRGKTVDVAVAAAMHELGVEDRQRLEVEVVQQPEKGFLGFGGQDAVVRVSLKADPSKRRRRRRKRKPDGEGGGQPSEASSSATSGGGRSGGRRAGGSDQTRRPKGGDSRPRQGGGGGRRPGDGARGREGSQGEQRQREEKQVPIEEQVPVVEEFLTGLVGSFGLDGTVEVGVDGDVIVATVNGSQTGAMVGPRGSVIEAIHELTKTVLHRKTESSARLRLDIAGYAERRREALTIYAGQLIDQVMDEGGEVMLEPMSAADRKVIHDAVAARSGVRSYSEGEAPKRYVVIASAEGEKGPAAGDDEDAESVGPGGSEEE